MDESFDIRDKDLASASALIRAMIAERSLSKEALTDKQVVQAFDVVGRAAATGRDADRLEAIALLGKASEVSKPIATVALPFIEEALILPMPEIGEWGTAEDRYYLAKGLSVSPAEWVAPYAAAELARADAAERKSREIWSAIAVDRARDLSSVLRAVAAALLSDRDAGGRSPDKAARKLVRTCGVLRTRLPVADKPVGDGVGSAFTLLVLDAVGRKGPIDRDVRAETAVGVLDFLIEMLRLKFASTLDPEIYVAAGIVTGWWKPARPSEEVRALTERIADIAMASLHMLARQGVSQEAVRRALSNAVGADVVDQVGAEIARRDPSLDPALARWLAEGRDLPASRSNAAVRYIAEQDLDELVARLLLAVENQEGGPQSLELIADDLVLLDPAHAATLKAATMRAKVVAQWANSIASRRKLSLLGERGDVVPFDPAIHESGDEVPISAHVRIQMPGVVKEMEGRPSRIVLKGRVGKP